ncbi:hypothetical protein HBI88_244880 [Parastagonospora nodorum]|nr:hypothetical protein HBI97_243430 [Parastagonospora nodorum]KAH5846203.1 hypothetical protein HBI90_243080 [Parastagonospora nodorum]KAH5848242.1 hypothetical protein HBI92_241350 [Parastagonospora nodorum]KAH5893507.1 hypothetical protein HBI88_244880 [Parastagonospora nodorum]KAH5920329.1 hypothetical protein HBI87_241920 [Parastagonospora nodorum]
MLFRYSVVVVVFVSLEQCSTVPRCLYLLLRVLGASRRLKLESKYLLSIMLRRSCVGSKSLVSLEQCSTISRCLYLLLRVLGAGYWRVCCLEIISLASLG